MTYDPVAHGALCHLCPMQGQKVVPPKPNISGKRPNLIIIGEGPGRYEEVKGEPFIGPAGLFLNETLNKAGIDRSRAWITNSTLCRPETDRDADAGAACCGPRLYRELHRAPADAPILCLGKPATRSVLGTSSILYARGFIWTAPQLDSAQVSAARNRVTSNKKLGLAKNPWMRRLQCSDAERPHVVADLRAIALEGRLHLAGRTVLPTVHPMFVLRLETWKCLFEIDLKRAGRVLRKEIRQTHDKGRHEIVRTAPQLKRALASLGGVVGFDIETDGIHPLTANTLCLGLSDGPHTFVIHPWEPNRDLATLNAFFQSGRIFVGHNVYSFDCPTMVWQFSTDQGKLHRLEKTGIVFDYSKVEDTLLAHHAYASHLPQRLDQLVSEYLDSAPWKVRFGRRGGDEKGVAPHQMEVEELALYNAADARLTIRTWRRMQADLAKERTIYEDDKRLARMCSRMHKNGVFVDQSRRKYLSGKLRLKATRLLSDMERLTGRQDFSPMKLDDLRSTLFGAFRAPIMRYTPTGLASTGAGVLQSLRGQDTKAGKLAGLVLDYRSAIKIRVTYLENPIIYPDGRVHPNWKPFGTVSGRLSSPHQQLPRITDPKNPALEDRVREIYCAKPGYVIFHFDISQAEMRCAANLSGDPVFMKAAAEKDVHVANAKIIFANFSGAIEALETDPKGRGKHFRDVAKNTGFAVNYLASDETLFLWMQAQKLPRPITMPEVRIMLARIHTAFKVHFQYIDRNVEFVQKRGYLRSPIAGRIRWFGWHPKPTEVANFPVQACVADVMNERLPRLEMLVRKAIPQARLIEQVHDAGDFEIPYDTADTMAELVAEVWDPDVVLPNGRRFKLPVDTKVGDRLSEL